MYFKISKNKILQVLTNIICRMFLQCTLQTMQSTSKWFIFIFSFSLFLKIPFFLSLPAPLAVFGYHALLTEKYKAWAVGSKNFERSFKFWKIFLLVISNSFCKGERHRKWRVSEKNSAHKQFSLIVEVKSHLSKPGFNVTD